LIEARLRLSSEMVQTCSISCKCRHSLNKKNPKTKNHQTIQLVPFLDYSTNVVTMLGVSNDILFIRTARALFDYPLDFKMLV
jgi:hypothetical protein